MKTNITSTNVRQTVFGLVGSMGLITLTGCGDVASNAPPPGAGAPAASAPVGNAQGDNDALAQPAPPAPPSAVPGATVAGGPQPTVVPPAQPNTVPPEAKKAEVGMGKKGQGYGGDPITEPIRQRFRIEDKIILDQIQHGLNNYKALNGRYPRTHDEFMKEIIQAAAIALPELYPDEKYVYDPKDAELKIAPK